VTPMKDSETLVAELRADQLIYNSGPAYEPLRVGPSKLMLRAADHIEALSQAPAKGEQEQIARVIDPEAWAWRPLPREPNEGPASKAAFDEQDRNDWREIEARKQAAYAKADAILALSSPTEGRMREALESIVRNSNASSDQVKVMKDIARQDLNHEEQSDV
jgi:hypothetical protein